ncbi:MAG: tetratricopeptide repeat protein [Bryobacterales bacterium]|nr:tetratricopeptide repeat protein [Bryobacterales bacterium]
MSTDQSDAGALHRDDASERAAVLHQRGLMQAEYGDAAGALRFFEQSLAMEQRLGDGLGIAANLHGMAGLALDAGDDARALRLYQDALAIRERLADTPGIAATLHQLGLVAAESGDDREALALYERSLRISTESGSDAGRAPTLYRIAGIYAAREDWAAAAGFYRRAAECYSRIDNVERTAECHACLAAAAFVNGDAAVAIENGREAVREFASIAHWPRMVGLLAALPAYEPEMALSWLAQAAWLACAMPGMSQDGMDVISAITRRLPTGCTLELTIAALTVLRLEREAGWRKLALMDPARALLELAAMNHDMEEEALEAWLQGRRTGFTTLYREVLDGLAALVHTEWLFERSAVPRAR